MARLLAEGFSVEQLRDAVDGAQADRWARDTAAMAISVVFGENFERYAGDGAVVRRRREHALRRERERDRDRPIAPPIPIPMPIDDQQDAARNVLKVLQKMGAA